MTRDAGERLRRLERHPDADGPEAPGLTIDVPRERVAHVVDELREQVGAEYFVFRSEQRFGHGPDEIAVLKTTDQFEVLRVMGTNGWNYDLSPEAVIARVRAWDAEYGLALRGAGFDWLEAEITRPPSDMRSFAEAVYAFCPDVVEQGTQTVAALADEMRRSRTLYLWWD